MVGFQIQYGLLSDTVGLLSATVYIRCCYSVCLALVLHLHISQVTEIFLIMFYNMYFELMLHSPFWCSFRKILSIYPLTKIHGYSVSVS